MPVEKIKYINVYNARENNLKGIDVTIPKNKLVIVTGLSGSGKSSLAFDTIYAEGQRMYMESLSSYARQFLQMPDKPKVDKITGLSPTIAINQKSVSKNPRSTVGTVTEIYDYLRVLYARIGIPYSPATGKPIKGLSVTQITDRIMLLEPESKIYIIAEIVKNRKGEHKKEISNLMHQGYTRFKINDVLYESDNLPLIDKNKQNSISVIVDRLIINNDLGNRLAESIETALNIGDGLLHVEILSDDLSCKEKLTFSARFACPESGFSIPEIEPRMFSFNSSYGACKMCDGLGKSKFYSSETIIKNPDLPLFSGAAPIINELIEKGINEESFYPLIAKIKNILSKDDYNLNMPWSNIPKDYQDAILSGKGKLVKFVNDLIIAYGNDDAKQEAETFSASDVCNACSGTRLSEKALCIKINNKNIGELSQLSIKDAKLWIDSLDQFLTEYESTIAKKLIEEVSSRLGFLLNIGLKYLTLDRESTTLSGGESQRIRLASQLGSELSGVIYVLDEPSIGLHQSDNERLIATLKKLRDQDNTVLVVEHDEETIECADYIIDMGPGAGECGGQMMACGTPQEISENKNSITGEYLSKRKNITINTSEKRKSDFYLMLEGININNVKNVNMKFPLQSFVCITGVSGSGKSSIVIDVLRKALYDSLGGNELHIKQISDTNKYNTNLNVVKKVETPKSCSYSKMIGAEKLDKLIEINQNPIGRTPASNPAIYAGVFTNIREWYASLPESKARGYTSSRFSFNVSGGRCNTCKGAGLITVEMHFLSNTYVKCEVCSGKRYNKETLDIRYKNKSIADVLELTVNEACDFFKEIPSITNKFSTLKEVGLGYLRVGQSSTHLSGGEAQRVKLAKELIKKSTGKTLYIFDEPTTGLHSEDVNILLKVLHHLVDLGNTLVVIEHNMHVIKTADYILDIGPGSGVEGGKIVASGTPTEVAENTESITGQYLKTYLYDLK